MSEFIKTVLSLSVSGTLLLLLIFGLKLLYKNKFSRRWQYYIWMIVVLRFLIPYTLDHMNMGTLLEKFHTVVITNENAISLHMPDAAAEHSFDRYVHVFFAWAIVALVLLVRKITIYQAFIRYIKAGNIEVSDIKILNLLSDCEEKLKIKARVELYCNTQIKSPIMTGFFRPSIVLPIGELEDKQLSYIFMHELLHYKQRDMFYKWLIQIVICIHWFNPFVYLLEKEVNKACELSCDETVISMLDDHTRREYGDTLIYFLKLNNLCKGSLASLTLTEGAEQLKERLGAIMNFKKKTKAIQILTGILTFCIIFGAAFISVDPVAAAIYAEPSENSKASVTKKNRNTSTYPFEKDWDWDDEDWDWDDEDWDWDDEDWDWDDEDWDWDDEDWDWDDEDWDDDDWDDEDWDFDWDWDDKALIEAYAAYGIEKNGKSYYYKGDLVRILKDQRPDSSFYTLEPNSKGTVSIKVVRNAKGKITGVSYMTKKEVAELLPKLLGGANMDS